jgi:hypothetical protein
MDILVVWFIVWCLIQLVPKEPIRTVILVIGLVLVVIGYGYVHIGHGVVVR